MSSAYRQVESAAYETRRFFEHTISETDRQLLMELYAAYNPAVGDAGQFVDAAIESFPRGACGLASLFNRYLLGRGDVSYRGYLADGQRVGHTVLEVTDLSIISCVTADQFGGLPVYVGRRQDPWVL